eukprot:4576931-Amphidinium_carterae.2
MWHGPLLAEKKAKLALGCTGRSGQVSHQQPQATRTALQLKRVQLTFCIRYRLNKKLLEFKHIFCSTLVCAI